MHLGGTGCAPWTSPVVLLCRQGEDVVLYGAGPVGKKGVSFEVDVDETELPSASCAWSGSRTHKVFASPTARSGQENGQEDKGLADGEERARARG